MDQELLDRFLAGQANDAEMEICEAYLRRRDVAIDASLLDGGDSLLSSLRAAGDTEALALETSGIVRQVQELAGRQTFSPEDIQRVLSPALEDDELGRIDRYRVVEFIACGGMGLVFKAEDPDLNRLVCIKVMHPRLASQAGARERFERESHAAARLRNERIVTILDVGVHRDVPYLVMQLLEGESLRGLLDRREKLDPRQASRLAIQIAEGLRYAHDQGLLHRDVKPDNIWVTSEGDVKLLDFGLARAVDESANLTNTGTVIGTPRYMSPEQVRGETVDCRSDLFSLGVVLFEMLAGRSPFQRENLFTTLMAVANDSPRTRQIADKAGPPEALRSILDQLLAKDPQDRPTSAAAVIRLLEPIANPSQRPAAMKAHRGGWRTAALASLATLAILALAAVISVATNKGTLVVKAEPGVAVTLQDETIKVVDPETGREFSIRIGDNRLPSGVYQLQLREADSQYELSSDVIAIRRGGKVIVSVSLRPGPGTKSPQAEPLAAVPSRLPDDSFEDGKGSVLEFKVSGPTDWQKLRAAIVRRVDPDGQTGIRIRMDEAGFVEMFVPIGDGWLRQHVQVMLSLIGKLEFAIVADPQRHAALIELAKKSSEQNVYEGQRLVARWVQPDQDVDLTDCLVRRSATSEPFRVTDPRTDRRRLSILVVMEPDLLDHGGAEPKSLAGTISSAKVVTDPNGAPGIEFELNDQGAAAMKRLTQSYLPAPDGRVFRLAILLDDQVLSAPKIQDVIGARGLISGRFKKGQAELIAHVLESGPLPAGLHLTIAREATGVKATQQQADDIPVEDAAPDPLSALMADPAVSDEQKQRVRRQIDELIRQARRRSPAAKAFDLVELANSPLDVASLLKLRPGISLTASATVERPKQLDLPGWSIESMRHSSGVTAADIAPSGKWIATGSAQGMVRVWDADGQLKWVLPCGDAVRQVCWSPHPNVFAVVVQGSTANQVMIWLLQESGGKLVGHIPVVAKAMAWSPDARTLVLQAKSLQFYDVTQGKAFTLPNMGMEGLITDRPWSPDSHYFASQVGEDVHVWDLWDKKLVHKFTGMTGGRWLPDQQQVAVQRTDANGISFEVWAIPGMTRERQILFPKEARSPTWHSGTDTAAHLGADGELVVRDLATPAEFSAPSPPSPENRSLKARLRWSAGGECLLAYDVDHAWTLRRPQAATEPWGQREFQLANSPFQVGGAQAVGQRLLLSSNLEEMRRIRLLDLVTQQYVWRRDAPVRSKENPNLKNPVVTNLGPAGSLLAIYDVSQEERTLRLGSGQANITTSEVDLEVVAVETGESLLRKQIQGAETVHWSAGQEFLWTPPAISNESFPRTAGKYFLWDARQRQEVPTPNGANYFSFRQGYTLPDREMTTEVINGSKGLFVHPTTENDLEVFNVVTQKREGKLAFSSGPMMSLGGNILWLVASDGTEGIVNLEQTPLSIAVLQGQLARAPLVSVQVSPGGQYALRMATPRPGRNSPAETSLQLIETAHAAVQLKSEPVFSDSLSRFPQARWHTNKLVFAWYDRSGARWCDAETRAITSFSQPGIQVQGLLPTNWGWLLLDSRNLLAFDPHGKLLGRCVSTGIADPQDGEGKPNQWITASGDWSGGDRPVEVVAVSWDGSCFRTQPIHEFAQQSGLQHDPAAISRMMNPPPPRP